MYIAAARLGCKGDFVVSEWGISHPSCMNGLKHYCYFVRGSFLARKAVQVLNSWAQIVGLIATLQIVGLIATLLLLFYN